METVTITCPQCGFSKELPASSLPTLGTWANCPKCRMSFRLGNDCVLSRPGVQRDPDPSHQATPPSPSPSTGGETWLEPAPGAKERHDSRQKKTLSFAFTGNAKEYFGIWIVNTLLRIVTFGIYSPWAKVRKRRYFYGNTLLNDAPFDYLADPLAILKGWFIAGAFFGLYSLASQVSPILATALMLVLFAVYPWVLVRSRIFNLRNSSHRNIRFAFRPDYRGAYQVFLWWQMLTPLTLGILAPYVLYRQKRFLIENSSYGSTGFSFHATPQEYYRVFLPLLILIPVLIASVVALPLMVPKGGGKLADPSLALLPLVLFPIIYYVAVIYLPTALANLTWNSTEIAGYRFVSKLRVRDLVWINFSNAVAIVASLGLLAPWASVRLARYRLERLALTGAGDWDSITASTAEAVGATGEELGDMLGYDFGL